MSAAAAAALVIGVAACGGEPAPRDEATPAAASGPTTPEAPAPLTLEDVEAFDLRADAEGALLVYARGGELHYARLDRVGRADGVAQRVARLEGRVPALVAGVSAGRVAIAWLRRVGGEVHVERVLGVGRRPAFGPPSVIERWVMDEAAARELGARELALHATSTGEFRLLHRAAPIACEGSAACATYRHSALVALPLPRPSSPSLAARAVCPWALPGVVEAAGRTFYGLCALSEGTPQSTLYLLQPEPQYAQAEPALAGCRPLGVLAASDVPRDRAGEFALFAADCPSGREAVRLGQPGISAQPVGPVLAPTCSDAGPQLRVGALTIPLTTPRDRLEGFLPSAQDPAGARAVFTGDVFLVAERVGSTLSVRALPCETAAAL